MENRIIKFRVWDKVDYMSTPFTIQDVQSGALGFTKDCPIMQYTGINDVNGKEIYEGDLVKTSMGIKEVFYHKSMFAVKLTGNIVAPIFHEEVEIIGNIYQKGK